MSLPNSVLEEFATHAARAKQAERARRETVQPVNLVDDASETVAAADPTEALGKRQPTDKFAGCANLRTLRTLLKMIDDRGYERSDHQRMFHASFERCTARALYHGEFEVSRSSIMEINGWDTTPSEVLVSTPRRFGKTFSVAIFAACLALSMGVELLRDGPAGRFWNGCQLLTQTLQFASDRYTPSQFHATLSLEQIAEFVKVLDCDSRITEYNQEALRIQAFDGKKSLVR